MRLLTLGFLALLSLVPLPAAENKTLNVDFPNSDARTVVASVADLFNLNVVIPDTLSGRTSIKLTNATWQQIYAAVLRPVGYTYEMQGNIIKIVPLPGTNASVAADENISPADRLARHGIVFERSNLDRQPSVKVQAKPEFPAEMRRNGVSGVVTVEFIVDADGSVVDAWAGKSTSPAFEASAVAAVKKWKFAPGMKGGKPVATHMAIDLSFGSNGAR